MPDQYAVIGNPIEHSKSPLIHAAFARQTGEDITYGRILGEPGQFAVAAKRFFAAGGRGLNVTVPFKQDAFELAERLSPRAADAGAVNTLARLPEGALFGDNTDGAGLVRDLTVNQGIAVRDAEVLVLGAGGAVRGVLRPLLDERPARLTIANRTPGKAVELAARFGASIAVAGCGFDALAGRAFDLIVNGTAAGLSGELPPLPDGCLRDGATVYDMLYADRPTAFMEWGRTQGAAIALDGLGMLIEQAAESFLLWRGVRPDTAPVFALLRDA